MAISARDGGRDDREREKHVEAKIERIISFLAEALRISAGGLGWPLPKDRFDAYRFRQRGSSIS